ncbi:hypothetical protein NPX13_g7157 [Xylaria arbuscula]|uniref:Uncharacterized protein n=1 Tax=Xylaria arbuscula TaxID=114810 RepID=A0A9W8TKQ3_9PEZI|nr:hypothetical protein NPX13_g7157 [Xylaria arbuscula]
MENAPDNSTIFGGIIEYETKYFVGQTNALVDAALKNALDKTRITIQFTFCKGSKPTCTNSMRYDGEDDNPETFEPFIPPGVDPSQLLRRIPRPVCPMPPQITGKRKLYFYTPVHPNPYIISNGFTDFFRLALGLSYCEGHHYSYCVQAGKRLTPTGDRSPKPDDMVIGIYHLLEWDDAADNEAIGFEFRYAVDKLRECARWRENPCCPQRATEAQQENNDQPPSPTEGTHPDPGSSQGPCLSPPLPHPSSLRIATEAQRKDNNGGPSSTTEETHSDLKYCPNPYPSPPLPQ